MRFGIKAVSMSIILIMFVYANYNYFFTYKMLNPTYNLPMHEAAEDFEEYAGDEEWVITNVYHPSYYFGEKNTYVDLYWLREFLEPSEYPSSMWFLMKSIGQIDFKGESDVFIDSLVNSGSYNRCYEKDYARFDDKTLMWFQKLLGEVRHPYRLSLINIKRQF